MALLFIALLIWFFRMPVVKTPNMSLPTAQGSNAAFSANTNVVAHGPSTVATVRSVAVSVLDKTSQAMGGLAAINDEEINFRGQVVDQFNAPVANATILATVRVNNGTRVGADHFTLTSDNNGLFSVTGRRGKDLELMIKKDGYVLGTARTVFIYSQMWPKSQRYVPDPDKPTVIKMWKLQGAGPLVSINQNYKVPCVTTPIDFDLVAGQVVQAGGDIRITVARPQGIVSQQYPQDWGISVAGVDGGLIETTFEDANVTYNPPTEGYQPSISLPMTTTNHWSGSIEKTFFVSSRNGQVHSKIHILFHINRKAEDPMVISFKGVASTNGSGNWEASAQAQ